MSGKTKVAAKKSVQQVGKSVSARKKSPNLNPLCKSPIASTTLSILSKYSDSDNRLARVKAAINGVKATVILDLVTISGKNKSTVAEWLEVNEKTMSRYLKENKPLNRTQSEKTLKYINLYRIGTKIFGSPESFNNWLQKPSYGLGNELPAKLMATSDGIDEVEDEVMRIAHGDLA